MDLYRFQPTAQVMLLPGQPTGVTLGLSPLDSAPPPQTCLPSSRMTLRNHRLPPTRPRALRRVRHEQRHFRLQGKRVSGSHSALSSLTLIHLCDGLTRIPLTGCLAQSSRAIHAVYNPLVIHARRSFPLILLLAVVWTLRAQEQKPPAKHPRNERTEHEARRVIEAYFPLFNKRDVKGLLAVVNFPHIRVTDSGTVIIPSANEWRGDPTPLENYWHHSALESLTFVQSDGSKAHALVVFGRYKSNGERYISYPTLWIVTKINGHWGIQVRSTFAP